MEPAGPTARIAGIVAGVIADDLTGAQEVGALLAARRLRTVVTTAWGTDISDCEAVVVDTESRHIRESEAAERVRSAVAALRAQGTQRFFKKLDSTLRGNLRAELLAFSEALDGGDILFTPAYPRLGRTVRGGVLYVNGRSLAQTDFVRDPRSPVSESSIAQVLGGAARNIRISDAETDQDLDRLVQQPAGAFAGSGGLAGSWTRTLPQGQSFPQSLSPARRIVLISGSRHPVSCDQARLAEKLGVRVLATPDELGNSEELAELLARDAASVVEADRPNLLILFGGDTAYTVLREMGVTNLWPAREVLAGVPVSLAHLKDREMMVVTKAGGFGDPDVVERILSHLT